MYLKCLMVNHKWNAGQIVSACPQICLLFFCFLFVALGGNYPDNNKFPCPLVSSGFGHRESQQEVREGGEVRIQFFWFRPVGCLHIWRKSEMRGNVWLVPPAWSLKRKMTSVAPLLLLLGYGFLLPFPIYCHNLTIAPLWALLESS